MPRLYEQLIFPQTAFGQHHFLENLFWFSIQIHARTSPNEKYGFLITVTPNDAWNALTREDTTPKWAGVFCDGLQRARPLTVRLWFKAGDKSRPHNTADRDHDGGACRQCAGFTDCVCTIDGASYRRRGRQNKAKRTRIQKLWLGFRGGNAPLSILIQKVFVMKAS